MLKSHFNLARPEPDDDEPSEQKEQEEREERGEREEQEPNDEKMSAEFGEHIIEQLSVEHESDEEKEEKVIILDPSDQVTLSKSQVSTRLGLIGKTPDNDGFTYIKADLSNMHLTHLDMIKSFKHLLFLDVSGNDIQLTELQAITALPYLVCIQADKNKLNSAALRKMQYLQVMIMNENTIKTVEDIFQPELSTLELGFNNIKELNFKNRMPEMKCLDFRNNKITGIEGLDFPKLDSLYLAYNKITSLVGLEKLVNLRILHVRGNPLRLLDGFHEDLKKLTYINMRSCKVPTMKQVKRLRVLSALETLVLKGCPVLGGTGNEAEDGDAEEDPETRIAVFAALPRLKRLNKGVITPEEKDEAKALMMQWMEEGEKDEEEESEHEETGEEHQPE